MAKAVVFDFDGTILDSESHWPETSKSLYWDMIGREWTQEDQHRMVGQSRKEAHAIMARDYGVTLDFDAYSKLVDHHASDVYTTRATLMPGVKDLFSRLHALGVPMAISSAGNRPGIETALGRLGVSGFFPVICSSEDVANSKPAPDLYLLAAERLGMRASDCIAIEDSYPGLTSAKTAGMYCIAYRTGHNAQQDLSAADMQIGHFDELAEARLRELLA